MSGRRPERHRDGVRCGPFGLRSGRVTRGRRGPRGRCDGTAGHAERPRVVVAGRGGAYSRVDRLHHGLGSAAITGRLPSGSCTVLSQ